MNLAKKDKMSLALLGILALLTSAGAVMAEWHIILDERFDRDPRTNQWPWRTPHEERNTFYSWYFNTRNWPIYGNIAPPATDCGQPGKSEPSPRST